MDSKLISSNIAWYSRYEIIHATFVKCVSEEALNRIDDQLVRQQALDFFQEDAAKTVYRTDSETMGKRLLSLGIVIDYLLTHNIIDDATLLERVFNEQYDKSEEGIVSVRDKKKLCARSLQNPHDPDAEYRGKNGKKVKGYSTNITETTDEPDKPSLVTDVKVEGATAADNGFVEDAVESTKDVTGNEVQTIYTDGAYQSEENRKFAEDNGIKFITNGIQGKPSRFDLDLIDEHTLQVTDKTTSEVQTAIYVKQGLWKIPIESSDGKNTWRYFTKEQVDKAKVRRKVESIPFEERKKRNNVEATIFQYSFHTRNNKTRYRTKTKHTLQAIARCAWINMRRLFLYDLEMGLQMATK